MTTAAVALVVAAILCSLVAGFLFAFAVVVMPGIGRLDDRAFVRAFQVIDGVIQDGQPLFGLVWAGSALALAVALGFGFGQVSGTDRVLLSIAGITHFLGVQLPTLRINVPLNNQLQAVDLSTADDETVRAARAAFEPQWNRWNRIRTVLATVGAGALIGLTL